MQPPRRSPSRRSAAGCDLPVPDPVALAHSELLAEAIRQEMDSRGGILPFDRFMELALYAPGLGYYVAGSNKLGAAGDFVTAPEISPLFGLCLARQCAQVLENFPQGDVLEFGAGSGSLASTLMRELERQGRAPRRYLILEPSPDLRARQREVVQTLGRELASRFTWLDGMPENFCGVAIANEVLDAMPVQRFAIRDGAIRELAVRWSGSQFEECDVACRDDGLVAAVDELRMEGVELPEGYCTEVNLRAAAWVEQLSSTMVAGVVLVVDYGYPRSAYYLPERSMGTLMCHYRHRAHTDPYRYVGLQDLTAHVDFTRVAHAAVAAGLSVAGYCTQAQFLLSCGLDEFLAQSDPSDVESHFGLVQGAKQLILPGAMGERFQVLALTRGFPAPLLGFSMRDLRDRL